MSKPHPNDIYIGEDQWITFIELDGRQDEAINIDPMLEPIQAFLNLLETECVADCCGIDAFGLWSDNIHRAQNQIEDSSIADKVAAVRSQIENSGAKTFVSDKLNNYFDRQVLLQLLDHIGACLRGDTKGEQTE